jgi:hypothetical protein
MSPRQFNPAMLLISPKTACRRPGENSSKKAGGRLVSIPIAPKEPTPGAGRSCLDRTALWAAVFFLAGFAVRSAAGAGLPETSLAVPGSLIVTQFVSAPFPHPARAGGHSYQGRFFSTRDHYSDSTVAMFVPQRFHATKQVDFVVHFHGWNNTVAGTLKQFAVLEQFAASGKNAVLLVPEGPHDAPDSFGGKLEDTNGFQIFMAEAVRKLCANGVLPGTNCQIGSIILSGHSGGYHVIAAILDHGGLTQNIREVWLFDALYGGTGNFVAWQKRTAGRMLDIYTDHGGTKEETEKLMAFYRAAGVSFFAAADTNATPENLGAHRLVFLHSDMTHNDVFARRKTFEEFLKTSCLPNE